MKALVCESFGPPESLRVRDLPSPVPSAGEVLVSVHAAGVNFPDALMIQGKYQRKPPMPFIPGMEIAGVVAKVGADVAEFAVGDRICAHITQTGAFAEEALVTVNHGLAQLPPSVDFVHAAALPLAYGTAFEALSDRARLKAGETVLVLGASGGVGLAAVQLAKVMGARVIACASSDHKLEICKQYGADDLINYETEDLKRTVKELSAQRGVDIVIDTVGGGHAEPALRSMARNGRYCVIGFATGVIPRIPLNLVLLKGCSIVGVSIGMNADTDPNGYQSRLKQMIRWMDEGKFAPVVSATYPLDQAARAIGDLQARTAHGKLVIVMPSFAAGGAS